MRRILKTDKLYTSIGKPIRNGMLLVDEENRIEQVGSDLYEEGLEVTYLPGALCAGFINTHCHLELSHLKSKVKRKTGIDGFISELQQVRNAPEEEKLNAIRHANLVMQKQGIVAVADISNDTSTIEVKKNAAIRYHTFVELFGFAEDRAEEVYAQGRAIQEQFEAEGLAASIVPHSPYSVSRALLKKIREAKKGTLISIHNQESKGENEMFVNGSGKILEMLNRFGIDISGFKKTGKTALQSYLSQLPSDKPLLLVHNTFTSLEDIQIASNLNPNLFWCFCPKANLYIENQLPDFLQFIKAGVKCTLGTDSLASNTRLSIWEEIKTIQQAFPMIELNELIKWATLNGAQFLGIDDDFGSIEVGKQAKLNWIKGDAISPLF